MNDPGVTQDPNGQAVNAMKASKLLFPGERLGLVRPCDSKVLNRVAEGFLRRARSAAPRP